MERIEAIESASPLILMDHFQRYQWAQSCVYGTVLDIACGIGYGSRFIVSNESVTKYIGVDVAPQVVDEARTNYSSEKCSFHVGTAYDLSFIADESIDTIVSMETIEHLDKPELAMQEFRRVLKKDGILLGSVPTSLLDEYHDKLHGGNPYHLTRFDLGGIQKLLGRQFDFSKIYLSRIRLCIEIHPIVNDFGLLSRDRILAINEHSDKEELGIFLFVASSRNLQEIELGSILSSSNCVFLGPLYLNNDYANYLVLNDRYMAIANLYQELQCFYKTLQEQYVKLNLDYQSLLNTNDGAN